MADEATREVDQILRPVSVAARLVSSRLRASVAVGRLEPQKVLRATALQPLQDAMLAGHLYGMRRVMLWARPETAVKLGLFDSVLNFIKKRITVDVDALQAKIKTQALRVVDGVAKAVERKLRSSVDDLIAAGTNRVAAVRVLAQKFDSLGIKTSSESQVETAFRTQVQLTYAAGKWEADQDPDIQEILWGYKYVTVGDDRVRESHEALEGVTLPKDDEFWLRFWPPNGWNCRCQAIEIFKPRKIVKAPKKLKDGTEIEPDAGFDFNAGEVYSTGEDADDEELSLEFDESKHPRDAKGKFTSGGGSAGFVEEKKLGGSTGAVLGKNASGQKTVKKTGASKGHAASEARANDLYRALGVSVPESEIGPDGAYYAEFIEGDQLNNVDDEEMKQDVYDKIAENFVADALLGNWDVVGADEDNILVDKHGNPHRIDNGGALSYRAQGMPKGKAWGEEVTEITSMRDPKVNPLTAKVYGKLSDAEIKEQVERVVSKRDELLAKAGPDKEILGKRLDSLEKKYLGKAEPVKATGWGGKTTAQKESEFKSKLAAVTTSTGKPLNGSQISSLAKINDGTDDSTLFVPQSWKAATVAQIQKQYPDKKIKQINANAYLPKGPATSAADLSAKLGAGETLKAAEKELFDTYAKIAKETDAAPSVASYTSLSSPEYVAAEAAWRQNLTASERKAIQAFSASSYDAMRRVESGKTSGDMYPGIPKKVKDMNVALNRAPKYEGTVYRGIALGGAFEKTPGEHDKVYEAYTTVGATVEWDSMSSTSLGEGIAHGFTGGPKGIIFKINAKTVRDIRKVSLHPSEKELIATKGSKYKVTAVTKEYKKNLHNNVTLIEMDEL